METSTLLRSNVDPVTVPTYDVEIIMLWYGKLKEGSVNAVRLVCQEPIILGIDGVKSQSVAEVASLNSAVPYSVDISGNEYREESASDAYADVVC